MGFLSTEDCTTYIFMYIKVKIVESSIVWLELYDILYIIAICRAQLFNDATVLNEYCVNYKILNLIATTSIWRYSTSEVV